MRTQDRTILVTQ